MSNMQTRHLLDPETLAAMDREFRAGAYDQLDYPEAPRLDPARDPFERNFEWLQEPRGASVDPTWSVIRSRSQAESTKEAGRVVRQITLAGNLAGGTDEQIFHTWVGAGFVALCFAAGANGESALAAARSNDQPVEARVESLVNWLKTRPEFQELPDDDRLAVAVAAVGHYSAPSP